jgi:cysteine desulfurase
MRVYADNNATTMVAPEVLEEMAPYFTQYYGNPSSMHSFGAVAEDKLGEARERVAAFLGAGPAEVIFTSCGSESDNAAIRGTLESYPEKRHIVTTRVEHPAVLNFCKRMEDFGYHVTYLPVDSSGQIDLQELEDSITDETAVVSIMYANNETGVVFPVRKVAEIVKSKGSVFHCDAVQAAGKLLLDVRDIPFDLVTISGHKIHAPKGVAVLYVRRGTRFRPLIIGGHQEKGRRGGTENVPGIVALGKACELAMEQAEEERTRVRNLRDRLEKALLKQAPDARVNGEGSPRLPNTLNVSFEFVEGESILLLMNSVGIAGSSGSACTSGSLEPSHVLRAMGIPFTYAQGSVRFSLSRYSTEEEIDYIIEQLPPIITRLRGISPYGRETVRAQV